MNWKILNKIMTKTWSIEDNGISNKYLYSNEEAKKIMLELDTNGMVHRDDKVPYITWDRFDNMSDNTAKWLYKKCITLVEIKNKIK